MANPLAVILAGLGGGLNKYAEHTGKIQLAKQLAKIEDDIWEKKLKEQAARDMELYKRKLMMQAGMGMPEDYIDYVKTVSAAKRRPRAKGDGDALSERVNKLFE